MSYSCMPNIGDIISMHNKAILQQSDKNTKDGNKQCNCRDRSTCPLEGRCKEGPIVYKATLTLQNKLMVFLKILFAKFILLCLTHDVKCDR